MNTTANTYPRKECVESVAPIKDFSSKYPVLAAEQIEKGNLDADFLYGLLAENPRLMTKELLKKASKDTIQKINNNMDLVEGLLSFPEFLSDQALNEYAKDYLLTACNYPNLVKQIHRSTVEEWCLRHPVSVIHAQGSGNLATALLTVNDYTVAQNKLSKIS